LIDLSVGGTDKNPALFSDFCFALNEVIKELVDIFLAVVQSGNVPLSATVSLVFNHLSPLLTLDHCHLETLALDFCLVYNAGLFFRCINGFVDLFNVLQRL
jgi:hypothetical protein